MINNFDFDNLFKEHPKQNEKLLQEALFASKLALYKGILDHIQDFEETVSKLSRKTNLAAYVLKVYIFIRLIELFGCKPNSIKLLENLVNVEVERMITLYKELNE